MAHRWFIALIFASTITFNLDQHDIFRNDRNSPNGDVIQFIYDYGTFTGGEKVVARCIVVNNACITSATLPLAMNGNYFLRFAEFSQLDTQMINPVRSGSVIIHAPLRVINSPLRRRPSKPVTNPR